MMAHVAWPCQRAVDAGGLAESGRFERDAPAYAVPCLQKNAGVVPGGIADGAPADGATIRAALAAARR
jgi:8-hydroxy-5-deazaflavin:NADPH oxidoreductase